MIACVFLALAGAIPAEAPRHLDIYLEENHAGSFHHFARTLPLDSPHTLVLIDAHSDLSAVTASDRIREALRKAPSIEERDAILLRWRKEGIVQCFDWIEPLMPLPFEEVLWVAAPSLDPLRLGRAQVLARESLDGLLEAFPRDAGELGQRFLAIDWSGFEERLGKWDASRPTVASIDFDYFADVPDEGVEKAFARVIESVLRLPRLRAITFSISSPWLRDHAQAERLVYLALRASTDIANARVCIASNAPAIPDRSRRALELRKSGKEVPAFDWQQCGPAIRDLILARPERVCFTPDTPSFLQEWSRDPFRPRIYIRDEVADPDGWHRLPAKQSRELVIAGSHPTTRWHIRRPQASSTNVADFRLGFAENAPRFLILQSEFIVQGPRLSTSDLAPFLEPSTGAGTALIYATVEQEGETRQSNELLLAFRSGTGFRGTLSEFFARPYAFGCGLLPGGPDGLIANDCANFLISAFRREGWRIPWSDPKRFADQLEMLGEWKASTRALPISEEDIASGAVVHFGKHVGAVWEDKEPRGALTDEDLIAHHLEGFPEIVPLRALRTSRPTFRLMRLKTDPANIRLVFGGDVMLGRRVAESIDAGAKPLAGIAELLRSADWACVNLECVPSRLGEPAAGKRFHFRAHPTSPALLARSGIDAVSLANNHSRDFGEDAFADAITRLRAEKLGCVDGSERPECFTIRGRRFAVFACEDRAPEKVLSAITEAARDSIVIVLPHWGTEHASEPTEEQNAAADQLIAAGAGVIIGTGPHARQPVEFRNGTLIAWSLGNLVFDGPGPDAQWPRGTLLEVEISPRGHVARAKSHAVIISDDGRAALPDAE